MSGPIIGEPQYICDICGKKKPVSQMAGKCVTCGQFVCSTCAKLKDDKVYCPKHEPKGLCFIATAAYGTSMAPELDILRTFRDRDLEPNSIGKRLASLYYIASPPIADVIAHSESMRALVRLTLKPIIRKLKLKYNIKSPQD